MKSAHIPTLEHELSSLTTDLTALKPHLTTSYQLSGELASQEKERDHQHERRSQYREALEHVKRRLPIAVEVKLGGGG